MTTQTQPAAPAPMTLRAAPAIPALTENERTSLVSTINNTQSPALIGVLKAVEAAEFTVHASAAKVGRLYTASARAACSFPAGGYGYASGAITCPIGWLFVRAIEKANANRAPGAPFIKPSWEYDTRGNTGTVYFRVSINDVPKAAAIDALEAVKAALALHLPAALTGGIAVARETLKVVLTARTAEHVLGLAAKQAKEEVEAEIDYKARLEALRAEREAAVLAKLNNAGSAAVLDNCEGIPAEAMYLITEAARVAAAKRVCNAGPFGVSNQTIIQPVFG